jgi:hypothetical protein
MTSLAQLCRTKEQERVAKVLGEHGIETDVALLLASDARLRQCDLPPTVRSHVLSLIFRNWSDSADKSCIQIHVLFRGINCSLPQSNSNDCRQGSHHLMAFSLVAYSVGGSQNSQGPAIPAKP